MKYTFATVTYDEVGIDFQKIYDYVKNEYEADGNQIKDKWDIYDYFGDNIEYFLEKIFGYKFQTGGIGEIDNFNDSVLTSVWSDFGDWLEKQDS